MSDPAETSYEVEHDGKWSTLHKGRTLVMRKWGLQGGQPGQAWAALAQRPLLGTWHTSGAEMHGGKRVHQVIK